jgi:hypothetical protein
MAERFDLERLLAEQLQTSWSKARGELEAYALSGPETAFARALLRRKRNLWLYRCHQRRFCGDFVVVDMSAASPRPARVLELKAGEVPKAGCGGWQLRAAAEAVASLEGAHPHTCWTGDGEGLLEVLGR